MSESTSKAPHQPGVYVKGDAARVATSAAKAAALAFDGYVRQADDVTVEEVSNVLEAVEPVEAPKPTATPRAPRTQTPKDIA